MARNTKNKFKEEKILANGKKKKEQNKHHFKFTYLNISRYYSTTIIRQD